MRKIEKAQWKKSCLYVLFFFFFTVQNKFATAKKPKGWRSTSSPRKSQTSPMALFQPCSIISSSSSSFFQGSHPNLRSKVFVPKHQTHLIPNPKSRSLCTASWQEVRLVRTFFFSSRRVFMLFCLSILLGFLLFVTLDKACGSSNILGDSFHRCESHS